MTTSANEYLQGDASQFSAQHCEECACKEAACRWWCAS